MPEKSKPATAADYIYILLTKATWFNQEHRDMAEKHKGDANALKELFVCALDGVNVDILKIASNQEMPVQAFRRARENYFEEIYTKKYKEELKEIQNGFVSMTKEVKGLSGKVDELNDFIPNLEEIFQQSVPIRGQKTAELFPKGEKVDDVAEDILEPEANTVSAIEEDTKDIENSAKTESSEQKNETFETNNSSSQNRTYKYNFLSSLFKGNPSKFVQELFKEGYEKEQIDFVIKCLEEGYTQRDIMKFISVKMSVEQMQMMKKIYDKERRKNNG